jgi:hypothetical protein
MKQAQEIAMPDKHASGPRIARPCRCSAARVAMLLALALAAGACTAPDRQAQVPAHPAPAPAPAPNAPQLRSTDPCATRLHDLSGAFLLYYSEHGRLPARLDELPPLPGGGQAAQLACPESGHKYMYQPENPRRDAQGGRIILYDARPIHSGMRWAISIIDPEDGSPLVTRVIAIPPASN